MKYIATKLWIYFFRPIWSFIINLCYWILHITQLTTAIKTKNLLKDLPLSEVLNQFIWTEDKFKDWIPWVITIANNLWHDDCDGSATLAKYWYKTKGIKSEIIELFDSNFKIGHAICIRKDHTEFTSNNDVIEIKNPNDWKTELFKYFNDEYSIVI